MRRYTIIALLCLMHMPLVAQKPEHIYSFAIVYKPISYYREQAALWKKETELNQKNSEAWYNYYRATRNMARTDTTAERFVMEKNQAAIVEAMGKAVSDSYEYNVIMWMESPRDKASEKYIIKADQAAGGRMLHLQDMMILKELNCQTAERDRYALRYKESPELSPGMMYYCYNMLNGLKQNAIIITMGDNDTYPMWVLQSMGIRKDVTVINSSLIMVDSYRSMLFKQLGIAGYTNDDKDTTRKFHRGLLKHMAANTQKHPVYLALTAPLEMFSADYPENLFLTGLAYEYSDKNIDNIALLRRNFEHVYLLDYIDHPLYADISKERVEHINGNYIVPMIRLYEHYRDAGESVRAERIKAQAEKLAKGRHDEKQIMECLNKK